MPVYEYVCAGCGHAFEVLLYGSEPSHSQECASTRLDKQLSTFAARGETRPDDPPPGCGTCGDPRGPGACALD